MDRRVFLAVVLSAAIFIVWSILFPPPKPVRPAVDGRDAAPAKELNRQSDTGATGDPEAAPEQAVEEVASPTPAVVVEEATSATSEEEIELSNDVMKVTISNRGGVVSSFVLFGYRGDEGETLDLIQTVDVPERSLPLQLVTESGPDSQLYAVERIDNGVTLRWADGRGNAVDKTITMPVEGYGLGIDIETRGDLKNAAISLGTGLRDLGIAERNSRLSLWGEVVMMADGEVTRLRRRKVKAEEDLEPKVLRWVGFDDSYFLSVLRPESVIADVLVAPVDFEGTNAKGEPEELKALRLLVVAKNGQLKGTLLGAPKQYQLLQDLGDGLERTLDFGILGPISVLFLKVLWWIHAKVANWGLSIILLTLGIRIVLFPLMHTSTVSMRRMQKVQPKVKEIQAKYKKKKGDAQARAKMNQEMMTLYKEEGVNPMGGCLPLLVQMPILWGLYKLFLHSIELRHAPFIFWIQDLSAKDPYYITPILMMVTMWLQQRLAPQAGDPQQQKIMRMMPLVFGIMFLQFPSGLVLYWLTNNVLTIVQQEITLHLIGERKLRGAKG
jgi:YidC/Oxa1 family membrane protein insertase